MRASDQTQTVLAGAVIACAVVLSALTSFVLAARDRSVVAGAFFTPTAQPATVAPSPTAGPPTATTTPTPSPSPTPPPPSPTATPTPTATRTRRPTFTATATQRRTATPTPIPPTATRISRTPTRPPLCGPPAHWVQVRVLPGETLFRLAIRYGTTVAQLQQANCMGNSTILRNNQLLWVPPVIVVSPTPTP